MPVNSTQFNSLFSTRKYSVHIHNVFILTLFLSRCAPRCCAPVKSRNYRVCASNFGAHRSETLQEKWANFGINRYKPLFVKIIETMCCGDNPFRRYDGTSTKVQFNELKRALKRSFTFFSIYTSDNPAWRRLLWEHWSNSIINVDIF